MTIEYLCQRAYNEGISSSYTKIRTMHGVDGDMPSSIGLTEIHGSGSLWARVRRKQLREIVAALRKRVKRLVRIRSQPGADKSSKAQSEYSKAIAAAHEAGYAFHQKVGSLRCSWHGFFVLTIGMRKYRMWASEPLKVLFLRAIANGLRHSC